MSRTLGAGELSEAQAERSSVVHFVEINSSAGALRFNTTAQNVLWNGHTWLGSGAILALGDSQEVAGIDGPAVDLEFSGVDQAVISDILSNDVRGRSVVIYRGHIQDDGTVAADPWPVFAGLLNADWVIEETRKDEGRSGTVTVKTQALSLGSIGQQTRALTSSTAGHQAMLVRAGLAATDTFFRNVPFMAVRIVNWGDTPSALGGYITNGGRAS